jgi:hypothetical protein
MIPDTPPFLQLLAAVALVVVSVLFGMTWCPCI